MKKIFTSAIAMSMLSTATAAEAKKIGVANFADCLSQSKYGMESEFVEFCW